MSSLVLSGDTSGTVTLSVPAVAGSNTISVQAATASMSVNTLATAVASTSGTSIDFSSLPSWVKRITVMLSGVSTNGTSNLQCQIGSGSVTTSGYAGGYSRGSTAASASSGLVIQVTPAAASAYYGLATFTNLSGNTWVGSGNTITGASDAATLSNCSITLGGVLNIVRLTTVNGTDTFDAGSVNILYEG